MKLLDVCVFGLTVTAACTMAIAAAPRAIRIEAAAIPAQYSAPLPRSVDAFKGWVRGTVKGPPMSHALDNLENGNAQWLGRLKIASAAVPEADFLAWGLAWQAVLEFRSPGPAFCALVREVMAGPPGAMRIALVGTFASHCAKPQDRELMLRADTPNWAVLNFFDPDLVWPSSPRPPFDARLAAAAREVILASPPPSKPAPAMHTDSRGGVMFEVDPFAPSHSPRSAAFTLTNQHSVQADEALLRIYAEIEDRKVADEVALAFMQSRNPKGKALAVDACKRLPADPVCANPKLMEADNVLPPRNVPPAEVKRIRARVAQLRSLGFTRVDAADTEMAESDDATELLLLAGYGTGFDTESDRYPNQHDSLMRTLARLAGPVLADAAFEERAPGVGDESTPYRIAAYAGGKRFSTTAENLGDWYDVDAVLALLNAVLADQKSDIRYAALDTGDQWIHVLAAPPATLAKAAAAGLIELGDAGKAEKTGKEFERHVIEGLRKEPEIAK